MLDRLRDTAQFLISAHPKRTAGLVCLAIGLVGASLPAEAQQHPTAVTSIVNSNADTTLEVNHSGGLLAPGKFIDLSNYSAPKDSIPGKGPGVRMMWYPEKAAFRAGSVGGTQWNANNVGKNSVALGRNTKARGDATMALGLGTTARFPGAVAMGNSTTAEGNGATAMGNHSIAAAFTATAMGRGAKTENSGSFVWNDGSLYHDFDGDGLDDGLSSAKEVVGSSGEPTGSGTFTIGAAGGVRFVTGTSEVTYISGGSTGWSTTSTRAAKTNIDRADPAAILEAVKTMPVSTWEYKGESGEGEGVLHIGPMAEDFHGELPYDLGSSDKNINSINADGVALGAIKGLSQKIKKQEKTIASLQKRVQEIETLKKRVAQLEGQSNGSVLAGLFGSLPAGLALVLVALGGGLAAGLVWRGS